VLTVHEQVTLLRADRIAASRPAVRLERAASVSTRLASGSMARARMVVWMNCTLGLLIRLRGWLTSSVVRWPNITSSTENPKTRGLRRSMRVISAPVPKRSDRLAVSSSPRSRRRERERGSAGSAGSGWS
jgi:hypothetical protein